jgi:hypothetical protein
MQGNLRRTRRTGMKGEKRAAYAMLVSDVESAEECLEILGSERCSRLVRKSGRKGGRGRMVFFDLAVSV